MEDIKVEEKIKKLKEKYRRLCFKAMKLRHRNELNKIKRDLRVIEKQLKGYKEEYDIVAWAKATVETEERLKDELLCSGCPFWDQRYACFIVLSLGALIESESISSKSIMNFLNEIDGELFKALEKFWIKLKRFVRELEI